MMRNKWDSAEKYNEITEIQNQLGLFSQAKNNLDPHVETLKIIGIYLILGVLWIVFSDEILTLYAKDIDSFTNLQTYKGWAYVVISGLVFYYIILKKIKLFEDVTDMVINGYEELSGAHEELIAMEEELNSQFNIQMELEEILNKEKELSENIINGAAIIIVALASDGSILLLNPYAEKVTGYKKNEVKGKNYYDIFIAMDNRSHTESIVNKILKGEVINNQENLMLTKSGEFIYVLWNNSPIYGGKGETQGLVMLGLDITERKIMENKLISLAYYDRLTGLPNRQMFENNLCDYINLARVNKSKVALLYLDLDNFKNVNDTFGHAYGDKLIKEISSELSRILRDKSSVARLGGDEFGIIFSNSSNTSELYNEINKLMKSFNKVWVIEGNEVYVTTSIGIAIYPDDGTNVDTLLSNADTAMYVAKETSKNCFVFYTEDMKEKAQNYLSMEKDLRRALQNNELILYYQPVIDLENKSLVGYEALIRWVHPSKGLILPSDFILFAEEMGLIVDIDDFVIREACKQIREWHNLGYPEIKISINLSSRQLRQYNLIQKLNQAIKQSNINGKNIIIEITENSALYDLNQTINILEKLKHLGITIALDDFGTGYSSLNYLKRLPVDIIKMDKDFVHNIPQNRNERIIIETVINLAHKMNLMITAEGIETEEQLKILQDYNCHYGQGYYFSKPVPSKEAGDLLFKN